jgi:hypothetical protein
MALALDSLGKYDQATTSAHLAFEIFHDLESPEADTVRRTLAEWQHAS